MNNLEEVIRHLREIQPYMKQMGDALEKYEELSLREHAQAIEVDANHHVEAAMATKHETIREWI